MFKLATLAGGISFYCKEKINKAQCFEYPATKEIIRGSYENKIRRHSPPEKIFEVFATQKDDKEILFMSHFDLFKALCPFNYSTKEADEEAQQAFKSATILNFADVDQDGLISLYEYYLIVCLIQADRTHIKEWFREQFEKDGIKDEIVTPELVSKFYHYIQESSKEKLTMTTMPDPRKVSLNKKEYEETLKQLIDNIFKKHPKLTLKQFVSMREDLLKDILKYEFNSFPQNSKGNISGEDFAKSLISFLDINKVSHYLKILNHVQFKGEISFTDYYVFQKFLQDNMEILNKTIENKGSITKNRLKKIIEQYHLKLKLKSNPDQIDIFIKILDIDNSGKIESDEFSGVVSKRAFYGNGDDSALQIPIVGIKEQIIKWINKAERIVDIVLE